VHVDGNKEILSRGLAKSRRGEIGPGVNEHICCQENRDDARIDTARVSRTEPKEDRADVNAHPEQREGKLFRRYKIGRDVTEVVPVDENELEKDEPPEVPVDALQAYPCLMGTEPFSCRLGYGRIVKHLLFTFRTEPGQRFEGGSAYTEFFCPLQNEFLKIRRIAEWAENSYLRQLFSIGRPHQE